MGLLWWGGLVVGWLAVGFLGVNKLVCNIASGGESGRVLQKYGGVGIARSYKVNSLGRFGYG